MKQAAIFSNQPDRIESVYSHGREQRIAELTQLYPHHISADNFEAHAPQLGDLEVIFSTWGMPPLGDVELDRLPNLRALFYGAGSVQKFARPLLERDVMVVNAAIANATTVAEFAVSLMLLANKGYFRNVQHYSQAGAGKKGMPCGPGNYHQTVALLGAGAVGRAVIKRLRPHRLHVLVWDPFLSDERAAELGVERVDTLEEAFERSYTVSNHLAANDETKHLITGDLFKRIPEGGAFINTGRGTTVDEPAMIETLKQRTDVAALLDVTSPEPPEPDSPLYQLPNVWLSSHLAGAQEDEKLALADWCIEQFQAWEAGQPVQGRVTLEMLKTMA